LSRTVAIEREEGKPKLKFGQISTSTSYVLARYLNGTPFRPTLLGDNYRLGSQAFARNSVRIYKECGTCQEEARTSAMTILENIEQRGSALKVKELAALLKVTPQHIYKLIALGIVPSVRIAGAIRLDPAEIAGWLRRGEPSHARGLRSRRR
jgi:excisionase family DNA binding protein